MAPPSLPQPLGRLPRDGLAGPSEYSPQHSPQSGMFALPATPASVGAARRKVRELLGAWSVGDDTVDNALLVTSELVTNALTHTASERIVCRLRLSAGRLHVEVEDENRGGTLPAQRMPGPDEQCGRGLLLVGILSSDWGVRDAPHGSGRIVWAELSAEQAEVTGANEPAAPVVASASGEASVPAAGSASVEPHAPAAASASGATSAPADRATSVTTEPAAAPPAPATPDTPAPVRPAPVLPPTPPAAHAAQVAAPAPWQPPAPHRTRPVPHSAEGTASHGPYGTFAPHHPYSRS